MNFKIGSYIAIIVLLIILIVIYRGSEKFDPYPSTRLHDFVRDDPQFDTTIYDDTQKKINDRAYVDREQMMFDISHPLANQPDY